MEVITKEKREGKQMLPGSLIVPTLQRVEEVLEDLDALGWELSQIVGYPELQESDALEAERKVAQAKNVLNQVLSLAQEILVPFSEEQAALKEAQEAVLQVTYEACIEARRQKERCFLNEDKFKISKGIWERVR